MYLRMKTRHLFIIALLVPLMGNVSCQKDPEPVVEEVVTLSLTPTSVSLTEGQTTSLSAVLSSSGGNNAGFKWTTSNPSVATVSDGFVTAVSSGQATITVRTGDGKYSASCAVTVNPAPVVKVESVGLNKTSLELTEGAGETLVATVKPDNATDRKVSWSSSDASVASVSSGGKVTALKVGSAIITVTTIDGGKTDRCTVVVKERSNSGGNEELYYEDWK